MKGLFHFIVIGFGILGLFLGGFLIDIDHRGPMSCKWKLFWGENHPCGDTMHRSILHHPVIMLSMSLFFLGIGAGLFIHYLMDYIPSP